MKILLSLIFVMAVYLNPLYPVFAQTPATGAATPLNARELVQQRIATQQGLLQSRNGIASRSAALKARLAQFRDKQKAAKVERVNNLLAQINERRTSMMTTHLNTMSGIVGKLENWLSNAAQNGKDTSEAQSALTSARTSIDGAKVVVDEQSQKDYTIQVSSEAGVAADAKAMREKLHNDLQATHDSIVSARQALANAIETAARTLLGGTN